MTQGNCKKVSTHSVGIIGCGWVGQALAKKLLSQKIEVLATSSQQKNVDKLNQISISSQQLSLPLNVTELALHDVFKQKNIVIAITPQLRKGRKDYADKVMQIVEAAKHKGIVEKIILLSSTAIYGGLEGTVDESSRIDLSTEKVQILNAAEQAVLNFSKLYNKQSVVLRLAGLVGPERHPGKFLLANKTLFNSNAPVNLIHQKDVVGLIEVILKKEMTSDIFNGVSDTHISKKIYYKAAAKSLNLSTPKDNRETIIKENNILKSSQENSMETTRIVSGEKVKRLLDYKFVYPDLLTWV